MAKTTQHTWQFASRFRRHAFGWRSQLPVKRVKEAISEIKKVARKNPLLGAEGAVRFLEKVSPALEQVDSSSGAMGNAVNRAVEALVPIIAQAPADAKTRDQWLERLWEAHANDGMGYIESLTDFWGELCVSKETASAWADRLRPTVELSWSPAPERRGYFHGVMACFSALLRAERYAEILDLLESAPYDWWYYRQWGVLALAGMGRTTEAIAYAEARRGVNDNPYAIARLCEEILLSQGQVEEAYRRYAIPANQANSNLATYRAIARKYADKSATDILHDLVASTPGEEGKWFATAKSLGLYAEAIALANQTPCDPRTLARAARDFEETQPGFAMEAGMTALRWLVADYGYEVTGLDVLHAYHHTLRAAERLGDRGKAEERIRELVSGDIGVAGLATQILRRELGLTGPTV